MLIDGLISDKTALAKGIPSSLNNRGVISGIGRSSVLPW